jgi:outer membrane protein W
MRSCIAISSLLVVLCVATADAQQHATDRGSIILAGDASIASSKSEDDDDRTTSILLAPSIQYFLQPGLAIGAQLTFGHSSNGDFSTSVYGIGPRVSYYFGQGARTSRPFVSAGFAFTKVNADADIAGDADFSARELTLRAGILFMLSNAVGLNPHVYYQTTTSRFDVAIGEREFNTNTFGLAVGVSAFVF